jgi:hypothetical protein
LLFSGQTVVDLRAVILRRTQQYEVIQETAIIKGYLDKLHCKGRKGRKRITPVQSVSSIFLWHHSQCHGFIHYLWQQPPNITPGKSAFSNQ